MRAKLVAGGLMALAFLIPAAPAVAATATPGPGGACQTVSPQVFKDIPELITIDLDAATDIQVRVQADQILSEANREALPVLQKALQDRLDGAADDLEAFLKTGLTNAWTEDLRVSALQTLTGAGPHVKAAAQQALDDGTADVLLAYLNDGLYAARALDCATPPTPNPSTTSSRPASTPSVTPSATTSAVAIPVPSASSPTSGGDGGGLPVTGAATGAVAGIGGALLFLGGVGYLIGRRRRSRFVA